MRCVFCDLISGSAAATEIHRDAVGVVFLDTSPANPGHVLIAPVQHCERLADLDPQTGGQLFALAQRAAAALTRSSIRADAANVLVADGRAAGQEVMHVHLHVIPRFDGDGVRFHFGCKSRPSRDVLDSIGHEIRDAW